LRTEAVPVSPPPLTTWAQWQATALFGEPLNGPLDDPDGDGSTNVEEYAHATDPRAASSVARVQPQLVTVGAARYAALFIPRRPDRSLSLGGGVSTNLTTWDWSPAATVVASQTIDGWTVRDAQPLTARPAAFLRARYSIP
jgi:hypothetical protein